MGMGWPMILAPDPSTSESRSPRTVHDSAAKNHGPPNSVAQPVEPVIHDLGSLPYQGDMPRSKTLVLHGIQTAPIETSNDRTVPSLIKNGFAQRVPSVQPPTCGLAKKKHHFLMYCVHPHGASMDKSGTDFSDMPGFIPGNPCTASLIQV